MHSKNPYDFHRSIMREPWQRFEFLFRYQSYRPYDTLFLLLFFLYEKHLSSFAAKYNRSNSNDRISHDSSCSRNKRDTLFRYSLILTFLFFFLTFQYMRFCFLAYFNPMTNKVSPRSWTNYRRIDARRSDNSEECIDFTTKHREKFYFVVNAPTFKSCLNELDRLESLQLFHNV